MRSREGKFVIVRGTIDGGFALLGPYDISDPLQEMQLDATCESLLEGYDPDEAQTVIKLQDPDEYMPRAEIMNEADQYGLDPKHYGIDENGLIERNGSLFSDEDLGGEAVEDESDVDLSNLNDPDFA